MSKLTYCVSLRVFSESIPSILDVVNKSRGSITLVKMEATQPTATTPLATHPSNGVGRGRGARAFKGSARLDITGRQHLMALLADGPKTMQRLQEEFAAKGFKANSASPAISHAINDGAVVRIGQYVGLPGQNIPLAKA